MPGLLDFFGSSDPQTLGLLGAAAQMMNASGPSLMPHSFGQVLGSGFQGMLQGQQQAAAMAQAKQLAELNGYKLKDAKSDFDNQELLRARNRKISEDLAKLDAPQPGAPTAMPTPPAMPMGGSMMAGSGLPQPGWMQAYQSPAAAAQAPAQHAAQPDLNAQLATRLMQEAEVYRRNGDTDGANKRFEMALKLQPEFSQTPQTGVGPDGKPIQYVLDKSGNPKVLNGILPRDKMEMMTLGGTSQAFNPYAVAPGQTFQHTMTPGEVESNNIARDRLNFDKTKETKPTFNAEVGGFIMPPSKTAPNGGITPLAGFTKPDKPLTESQGKAALFASRMAKADQTLEALASGDNATLMPGGIKRFAEGTGRVLGLGTESMGGALADTLGGATNWTQSASQQQVEQAQRDFLNAVLRQESGASISPSEFDNARKQYFAQPGDDKATLAQKAENRRTAIAGMSLQSGGGAAKLGGGAPATSGWSIQKVN